MQSSQEYLIGRKVFQQHKEITKQGDLGRGHFRK